MSHSQPDLSSLVSRIEQLEKQQYIIARYTVKVKRQLDKLTEQLKTRPELQQLESFQEAIAQLSKELADWQQQRNSANSWNETFDKLESLDQAEAFDTPNEEQEADDFLQESEELGISDEEFLRRYNEEERDFTGINLTGVNLSGKFLGYDLNLTRANLTQAKLAKAIFTGVNLRRANLTGAQLCEASFLNTNLSEANLEKADLHQANFKDTKLERANLSKANLR